MSLKVEDVMTEDVVTVEAKATVKEAVDVMNKNDIGCLIVVKDEKAIGIVTERDMLTRVLARGLDPGHTRVSEVMSAPVIVAEPKMELEEAARLMFKMKVKKLPVVSKGELIGLITLTDVARFQPQIIKLLKKAKALADAPKRMQKVVDYYIV